MFAAPEFSCSALENHGRSAYEDEGQTSLSFAIFYQHLGMIDVVECLFRWGELRAVEAGDGEPGDGVADVIHAGAVAATGLEAVFGREEPGDVDAAGEQMRATRKVG